MNSDQKTKLHLKRGRTSINLSLLVSSIWLFLFSLHLAAARSSEQVPPVSTAPPAGDTNFQNFLPLVATQSITQQIYFPLISNYRVPVASNAFRIGFANTRNDPSLYADVASLQAGWFTNWGTASQPKRPGGIEYVQMVRVHQKLSCGTRFAWNRETCPYAQPLDYIFLPSAAAIKTAAQANRGSTWLIGNEMDRVDFFCEGCPNSSDGQDEMLPETYARAYHDLYNTIKDADPTAKVAVGGLIQPTPLRLQWLSIAWNEYQKLYTTTMPVDIWNIHNFILQENKFGYGAAVPPGLPGDPTTGEYLGNDFTHIDPAVFDQQIRAMRQWMKDRGQQQKPLVITEYGVLYSHEVVSGTESLNFDNATLVHDFMLWTFDYFLDTKDCDLGFQADDCRLVQRWLWFSLDHAYTDTNGQVQGYFNTHTSLYDATTKQLFPAGEKFRDYVEAKFEELSQGWLN